MHILKYLQLIRFHFHLSFVSVVAGAFLFAHEITLQIVPQLLLCYIFFNVLLYGGIYTFNDIIDVEADGKHPIKKFRPLPSQSISIRAASVYCIGLVSTGILLGYCFLSPKIALLFVFFLVLNLVYTLFLKRVVFLNIANVAGTHTLRFFLGITLVHGSVHASTMLLYYVLLFGISITVHSLFNLREFERPYYASRVILAIQIGCLAMSLLALSLSGSSEQKPMLIFAILFFFFVLGSRQSYFQPMFARIFMIPRKAKVAH